MDQIAKFLKEVNQNFAKIHETLKKEDNPKAEIRRKIEKSLYLSQWAFVMGYTGLILKLALFNHYRRYNKTLKFSIVLLYQISIDPLTILAGYTSVGLASQFLINKN